MATYKYQGDFNYNLVISDLTALMGEVPLAAYGDGLLTVEVPDVFSEAVIRQIIEGHHPVQILSTAPAQVFAGGTAISHAGGLATGNTNIRDAVSAALSGATVDQKFGNGGDPFDAANPFSGVWIVYPAVAYPAGSGNSYNWFLIDANVLQSGAAIVGGKWVAGGGAITIDDNGLSLLSALSYSDPNFVKWVTSDGITTSHEFGFYTGSTPNRSVFHQIIARAEPGGTGQAFSQIYAQDDASIAAARLQISSVAGDDLSYLTSLNQTNIVHRGNMAGFNAIASSVAENDIYRRTIKANSLGTLGIIRVGLVAYLSNGSGSSRLTTFKIYLGSTVLWTIAATNLATGNTVSYYFDITISNTGGAAVQYATIDYKENAASGLGAPTHPLVGRVSATVNTALDQDFAVTGTMSASSSSLTQGLVGAYMLGPYYA